MIFRQFTMIINYFLMLFASFRNEGIGIVVTACDASPLPTPSTKDIVIHMIPVSMGNAPSFSDCSRFITICNQARSEQKVSYLLSSVVMIHRAVGTM